MAAKGWLRFWFAAAALSVAPALRAGETTVLPRGGYPSAAESEIDAATSSIRLYLYLFSYQPSEPDAGPARLARALVRAEERGVDVRVFLDRSLSSPDPAFAGAKNDAAGCFLSESGVDVFVSSGTATLHAKVLVVDGKTVLLGSTNWTTAAFDQNREADVLIRSTENARALLNSFEGLSGTPWVLASTATVPVPFAIVDSPASFGGIYRHRDIRALDAYLWLLRQGAVPGRPLFVDRAALADYLGWNDPVPSRNAGYLIRMFKRMRDEYRLLAFQAPRGGEFVVTLSSAPASGSFGLPMTYFNYGWDRRLSSAAKSFLLLSLRYSADSPIAPRWSLSQTVLGRLHRVPVRYLQDGILELERAHLLKVIHGSLSAGGAGPRATDVYTPLPFYDPAELDARWRELEKRYGADALASARALAALVYDDCDVLGVEEILGSMPRLPAGALEETAKILAAKARDNPRRTMGYLIGILRKKTRNE